MFDMVAAQLPPPIPKAIHSHGVQVAALNARRLIGPPEEASADFLDGPPYGGAPLPNARMTPHCTRVAGRKAMPESIEAPVRAGMAPVRRATLRLLGSVHITSKDRSTSPTVKQEI